MCRFPGLGNCNSTIGSHWFLQRILFCSRVASFWRAVIGLHHLSRYHVHTKKSRIRAIIMHSDFNKITYDNDIVLFKLMESIKFNQYIQPICIPDAPVALNDEMPCFITGWGQTTEKGDILFSIPISLLRMRKLDLNLNVPFWWWMEIIQKWGTTPLWAKDKLDILRVRCPLQSECSWNP